MRPEDNPKILVIPDPSGKIVTNQSQLPAEPLV